MNNIKVRQSNIELLRILSMLIIVIHHFLMNSIIPNLPELNYITKPLMMISHIGVICFVLISGYWGIKFSLKGFVKLFFYCSFYSVFIYLFAVLLKPELFNLNNIITSFIPMQWWFIPVYLCLFLLTPLVNTQLKNATKSEKILSIVLLTVVSFGFGQFVPSLIGGKNPINFILIYYLGNYLRTEFNLSPKFNLRKLIFLYFSFNIILFASVSFSKLYFPPMDSILFRMFYPYNGIGLILNSILFFVIFTKIKFSSKWVNWFASSSLAVYLIHENKYIGHYLYEYVKQLQIQIDNWIIFPFVVVISAVLVFMIAVFIDKLISPLFQLVTNQITSLSIFKKTDCKVKNILEKD